MVLVRSKWVPCQLFVYMYAVEEKKRAPQWRDPPLTQSPKRLICLLSGLAAMLLSSLA